MKIAFITPYFYPIIGGTQTVVLNLAKQLQWKNYDIEILTPKVDKKSKKNEIYEGIPVKRTSKFPQKTLNEIWFQFNIFFYLRKFDIIHVYHPYFALSGYLAKIFFKKKLYITLVGWDNYNPFGNSKIIDKLVKFFCDRGDVLFTSSNDLLKRAKNQNITKKIHLIPHGINLPSIKKKINIREKYNIGNKLIYLYVGRLVPVKNPLYMLKAWKKITNDCFFLLIVGDGPLVNEMKNYIKINNLKNIKMTGFVSNNELKNIYHNADVLIHYAIYESFGLSILEGMSYGLPIIASNTGAIPEIVTKDVGKLINLKDINSLIHAIQEMPKKINILKKNTIIKAKKYNWRKITKEYIKYYEK